MRRMKRGEGKFAPWTDCRHYGCDRYSIVAMTLLLRFPLLQPNSSIPTNLPAHNRFTSNSTAAHSIEDTSSASLLDPSCELTVGNLAVINSQLMKASSALRHAAASHSALVDEVEYFTALTEGVQPPTPRSYGGDEGLCTR